jgi:hypothetical protein
MRALALFLLPSEALAQQVSCPETMPQGSVEVAHAPSGWLGSSPSLARLDGGGMMRGHPKDIGYLRPEIRKGLARYTFDAGEEKWLYCSYGAAVQLAKRMDDKATRCELSSTKDQAGALAAITAVCR